jgi:hypothetical protein
MSELTWPLQFEPWNLSLFLISENQPTRTVALFSSRFSGAILISSGGSILVSGHNLCASVF